MNVGDFVSHIRQGPGRITEICPEYIEVKSPRGHLYKVNSAVADLELKPSLANGFAALLATRQPSADFLLHNIVDVTRRILVDERRSAISAKDLRLRLEPFVLHERKTYSSWWKQARSELLKSRVFTPDQKKKTVFILTEHTGPSNQIDWEREAGAVSSASDLLEMARSLSAVDPSDGGANKAAEVALGRAVEMGANNPSQREQIEIVLALCYIGPRIVGERRDQLLRLVTEVDFSALPINRDLDEDICVALNGLVGTEGRFLTLAY